MTPEGEPPLLVARGARVAVDGVVATGPLDLETTGRRLVLAGDTAVLLAAITGVPIGLPRALERAIHDELAPVRGRATIVQGELRVAGRLPGEGSPLGVALRDPPLPGELDVVDWVASAARVGLALAGTSTSLAQARAEEALALVGLADARTRPIRNLFPAERRVLAIALATVAHPRAVVVDRPLEALPPEGCDRVCAALEAVAARLPLILAVSSLDAATAEGWLAHRATDLAVLARGELAYVGTPSALPVGARRYRLVVRDRAEPLCATLVSRGVAVAGGPHHFVASFPEGFGPSDVLRAAAAVRAPVVELAPLM
jgi:ABC-type ATPase involved in cell division